MASWNLWHGCHKFSAGCLNCYVYRMDGRHQLDSSLVRKTNYFDLPLKRNRQGEYKIPSGETVYTCFTSDFFLEDADAWRPQAWQMMRQRSDLNFFFITKRIHRMQECLPPDWGEGYANVTIGCTVENQEMVEYRLPIFLKAAIRTKLIICEPLLGPEDLSPFLTPQIQQVVVGGESGVDVRVCDYAWVLKIREQCIAHRVAFHFKQTGANFRKEGRQYRIPRNLQGSQARKANIDYQPNGNGDALALRLMPQEKPIV